jgi:hypothetical protein
MIFSTLRIIAIVVAFALSIVLLDAVNGYLLLAVAAVVVVWAGRCRPEEEATGRQS